MRPLTESESEYDAAGRGRAKFDTESSDDEDLRKSVVNALHPSSYDVGPRQPAPGFDNGVVNALHPTPGPRQPASGFGNGVVKAPHPSSHARCRRIMAAPTGQRSRHDQTPVAWNR